MLEVDNLSVVFDGQNGPVNAVEQVSFSLAAGETLALVGESGSGKSVTALSILQLLPYPHARHPGGSIRFRGEELLGAPEARLREIRGGRIGIIFQEPMTSLNPLHTIGRQIAETLIVHRGMRAKAARSRTLELLDMVGIPEPAQRLDSFPHQLSGGQRQRVMIAMALANEPDLLIADEPTTALDVTIQQQILDLLLALKERLGMGLLLITHDLGVVRRVADRVCVMHLGRMVEQGPVVSLFEQPQDDYTRRLLAAEPKGVPEPVASDADTVLQAEAIRVHFPIKGGLLRRTLGEVRAVDGVSLALREGETIGVVGESGSGKSTLAFALLRLGRSSGSIRFQGRELQGLGSRALRPFREQMQIVFQDPYGSLSPRLSVGDIISEGLRLHRRELNSTAREQRICAVLEEVGLDPASRHRYPHEFSGGQRQRIAIARALVLEPRLLVLDEPTSALDLSVQAQIIELLRRLQASHRLAYLFISHDLKVVRALSHQIIVMRNGEVVERGSREAIFERPQSDYTRRLIQAAYL